MIADPTADAPTVLVTAVGARRGLARRSGGARLRGSRCRPGDSARRRRRPGAAADPAGFDRGAATRGAAGGASATGRGSPPGVRSAIWRCPRPAEGFELAAAAVTVGPRRPRRSAPAAGRCPAAARRRRLGTRLRRRCCAPTRRRPSSAGPGCRAICIAAGSRRGRSSSVSAGSPSAAPCSAPWRRMRPAAFRAGWSAALSHECYAGPRMTRELTQRELRNQSGEIMRALDRGEDFIVTSNGVPVGELRPIGRRDFVTRSTFARGLCGAPAIDYEAIPSTISMPSSIRIRRLVPGPSPDRGLLDTSVVIGLGRSSRATAPGNCDLDPDARRAGRGHLATDDSAERARRDRPASAGRGNLRIAPLRSDMRARLWSCLCGDRAVDASREEPARSI